MGTPTRSEGAIKPGAIERRTVRNVALDLGAKSISYCEVTNAEVVHRTTVGSLAGLKPLLGPDCAPARVAIEACREAWLVHSRLTEWGNEVLLVDTTRSRQLGIGQHGRKTDRIDAEVLAKALEARRIPAAHVLSPHRRELRRLLAVRRTLVESRTQYIVTIRGIARELGTELPRCDAENFASRMRKEKVVPAFADEVEPLLVVLEGVQRELDRVETRLKSAAAEEPVIAQLTTAPGIGTVIAASFVSVVDDANRFSRAHQVESYIGLVPSEDTSGGKTKRRLGSITKKGNSYLRAVLVQGAWSLLRSGSRADPLRRWAEAVAKRRGKRIAVIALARRLVGVLWAMWRDGTPYDAQLAARSSARGLRREARQLENHAEVQEHSAQKIRRQQSRTEPKGVTA